MRQSVFSALRGPIEAFQAGGGELIRLHIGDTYLEPPEAAIVDPAGRELALYGGVSGLDALRAELAERLMKRGLKSVTSAANVHVGCGCTHALFCAARAVLDPGDEVLVISPYWPLVIGVLRTGGVRPIEVPLSMRLFDEPELDLAAVLDAACTANTRALYFITPNNPDGQVYTRAQLEQMASFAQARNLWVFADEVYADFVYDGEHCSIANLPGMAERTISCYSLSKSHGLAGTRIGYVAAPEAVIEATRRVSTHTVYNVPVAMQRAALGALAGGEAWIEQARRIYREARDATAQALDALGTPYRLPRGGSFFFVDLREALAGRSMQALLERAIEEGVLLAPGDSFGEPFGSYARLCFTGAPIAQVQEGIARLGRAMEAAT